MTTKLNLTGQCLSGASLTLKFNDVKVAAAMIMFHLKVLEPPGGVFLLLFFVVFSRMTSAVPKNMELSEHA